MSEIAGLLERVIGQLARRIKRIFIENPVVPCYNRYQFLENVTLG